jgi:serine/threonine protein phosphatase PrpC
MFERLIKQCFLNEEKVTDTELRDIFQACHEECKLRDTALNNKSEFDCRGSGATATVAIVCGRELIVASVGDSRCIVGIEAKRDSGLFKCIELSEDHAPDRPDERRRIEKAGGVIKRLPGDVPFRVFLKGKSYPGLAMTRSIGDVCGEEAGIVPLPEIRRYKLDPKKQSFLVLASDGVWEFLSSEDVVAIVSQFDSTTTQEAVDAVVEAAIGKWKQFCPFAIDDITCIISWLT